MSGAAIAFFFDLNISGDLRYLVRPFACGGGLLKAIKKVFLIRRRRFMGNVKNLWLCGTKTITVLLCAAVLAGIVGCASQTGEAPKKSGGGCVSF
ncbi:MAG: hypothetical protein WCT30_07355, partial [Desulfurivibrionaceae bacterium]